MTGLEVVLLIIGAIVIVVSFIFSSKGELGSASVDTELTDEQKAAVKKQILEAFDEQMNIIHEKTQDSLDNLSTKKMSEMNEYAETILEEINRNHNEVVFLYDMMNEKKKEINNLMKDFKALSQATAEKAPEQPTPEQPTPEQPVEETPAKEAEPKPKATRTRRKKVLDQLDAVAEAVADDVSADVEPVKAPKTKKKSPAKSAAERTRTTVKKETEREDNKDISVFGTGNNNEKILELSSQGKSNVEIAKELGLGIGEVKLVIDLFRGGR